MLITYYINNVCGLLSKLHYAKLRLILLSWGTNAYFLRCPAILKSFSMIGNNFPGEVNFSDFVTIFVMAIRIVGFLLATLSSVILMIGTSYGQFFYHYI